MALSRTVAKIAIHLHVQVVNANGMSNVRMDQDVPVMVGGIWNLMSQRRQQMRASVTVYDENDHGCPKATFEIAPSEIISTPDSITYGFEFTYGEHRDFLKGGKEK